MNTYRRSLRRRGTRRAGRRSTRRCARCGGTRRRSTRGWPSVLRRTRVSRQRLPSLQTANPDSCIHTRTTSSDARSRLHEARSRWRVCVLSTAVIVGKAVAARECIALGHAILHRSFVRATAQIGRACRAVEAAGDLPDVIARVDERRLVPVGTLSYCQSHQRSLNF